MFRNYDCYSTLSLQSWRVFIAFNGGLVACWVGFRLNSLFFCHITLFWIIQKVLFFATLPFIGSSCRIERRLLCKLLLFCDFVFFVAWFREVTFVFYADFGILLGSSGCILNLWSRFLIGLTIQTGIWSWSHRSVPVMWRMNAACLEDRFGGCPISQVCTLFCRMWRLWCWLIIYKRILFILLVVIWLLIAHF